MPDQSGFAAAVGGFLQGYQATSQIKADRAAERRKDAALRMQQQEEDLRLQQAGYDRLTMPTVEAPPNPDANFVQRLGSTLAKPFRHQAEPQSILVKTHPSAAESSLAAQQQFEADQNAAKIGAQRDIAAGIQAGENSRTVATNAARIREAQIAANADHERVAVASVNQRDADRARIIDEAIEAGGGDFMKAGSILASNNPAAAFKYKITTSDLQAAADRYRDRKAQLTREGYQSREDIAAQRNGGAGFLPAGILKPGVVTQDTSRPQHLAPLSDTDKQAAARDRDFAKHLQDLGYRQGVDF